MFQLYHENIDPENAAFLEFVTEYLKKNSLSDPDSMPYLELYAHLRSAIRQYLKSPKTG